MANDAYEDYHFDQAERPVFLGSPATPAQPYQRAIGYAAVAIIVGLVSTLGNALVTVNLSLLQGSFGLEPVQASWLIGTFVAMNAGANLMLIRARVQYGIQQVTAILLVLYATAAIGQTMWPSYWGGLALRALSGMSAAGLITLCLYYLSQSLPAKYRLQAILISITVPQLATPIARLLPPEWLAQDHWRALHLTEAGLALGALAAIMWLPLPPTQRQRVLEPADLVTFLLLSGGLLTLCGVLASGRLLWWTDAPWLAYSLVAAVALIATALCIEHTRRKPLLDLGWISRKGILRFAAVAILVRLALAEQTYGAVGLLGSSGLTNEQLRLLFTIVLIAMIVGMLLAAATFSPQRLPLQILVSSLMIAAAAWLDSQSSIHTRPEQLYISQAMMAFGATLFLGPALIYGLGQVVAGGSHLLVSFVVLFSVTQNVGGLVGSAALGSLQTIRARAHMSQITEEALASDPFVYGRLQASQKTWESTIVDPAQRSLHAAGDLIGSVTRQAQVLAFNDVFMALCIFALLTAAYVAYLTYLLKKRMDSLQART